MLLLAIETSSTLGGAALLHNQKLLFEIKYNVKVQHSQQMLIEVDKLLTLAKVKLSDIDVFATSVGPGSFTGLRIAMNIIKGLAFASNKKVAAVSSLEALAYNVKFIHHNIMPIIDARKKMLYSARFANIDNVLTRLSPDSLITLQELSSFRNMKTLFVGDASEIYRHEIESIFQDNALFADNIFNIISPAIVGYLGIHKALNGDLISPIHLLPTYIRKSEAEVKLSN